MTRARRRMAHRTHLAALTPWQRWAIQHGDREGATAFPTPEDWDETYESVKDAIMASCDDPATQFRGYWRHDPEVPDELRRNMHFLGFTLAPEPFKSEYKAEYEQLMEARRAWLVERGYR